MVNPHLNLRHKRVKNFANSFIKSIWDIQGGGAMRNAHWGRLTYKRSRTLATLAFVGEPLPFTNFRVNALRLVE
jgi:hypothetical protein